MMKTKSVGKIVLGFTCLLVLSLLIIQIEAFGGINDVADGAQEAKVNEPDKDPILWQGSLHRNGDVDWYWFELPEATKLYLWFEKPDHRQFFCRLYAEGDKENAILEHDGLVREYLEIPLEAGRYYFKIFGVPGHFSLNDNEKYGYALETPKPGGKSGGGDDEEEPQPQPSPGGGEEEQELKPEDVERLLDALQSEEEDQREIEMREERGGLPEVLKDW